MWFRRFLPRDARRRAAIRPLQFQFESTEMLEQRSLLSALTVQLTADHDNTIYDVLPGDVSNGAGDYIVVGGSTGTAAARRGLVSFDVPSAGIPAGSTILDVVLSMNLAESVGGSASVSVNKLLKAWGEAGSDAPGNEFDGAAAQQFDATWLFSLFDGTAWANAGGDFAGSSAAVSVDSLGVYEWIGGGLISDVQEWLDNSVLNRGWLIQGSEVANNVKAFDSKDSANAVLRPTLEITYEEPVLPSVVEGRKFFDRNGDGIQVSPAVADLKLTFYQGKDYHNFYDGQEYWYRSQVDNSWYFVTPSGNLTKWDRTAHRLSGTLAATLDSRVWQQPSLLISSDPTAAEPWLNGFTFELVNSTGAVVATTISQDIDRNHDGIIQEATERGWYQFIDVGPGNFRVREVEKAGWTQSASATSPLAEISFSVDTTLGLKFSGSYHENHGGRGERWIAGTGSKWYYITPSGDLYNWNGTAASKTVLVQGTLVASLGMAYYNDPSLIWNAANPTITVTHGTVVLGGDFGNYQSAVISGRKWSDQNPDGVRNTYVYDPGLPIALDPNSGTIGGSSGSQTYLLWVHDAQTGDSRQVTYTLNPITRFTSYSTNNSSSSGTTLIGSLPGIVGSDPAAVADYLYADEPWLNGWTFELLNDRGFVVATSVTSDRDLNLNTTIEVDQERGWYMFAGVLPGTYTIREVQQPGWIQFSPAQTSMQSTIASLQTQYGFKPAANDSYNFGKLNERWLKDRTNAWFYITPTGTVFKWDQKSGGTRGSLVGTQVAQLSSSIYLNPNLLYSPSNSKVTVIGGSIINDRHFGNHHVIDGVFSALAGQLQ
jgi:hypothetical protein